MNLHDKIKLKRNELAGEIVGLCPAGQGRNGVKSYRVAFDGFIGDIEEPLFLRLFVLENQPHEIEQTNQIKEISEIKANAAEVIKETSHKYINEIKQLQDTIKSMKSKPRVKEGN